jgi:hypothetical protein
MHVSIQFDHSYFALHTRANLKQTHLMTTASTIKPVVLATPDQLRERIRQKSKLKGRQADDASRAEVVALIGARPVN